MLSKLTKKQNNVKIRNDDANGSTEKERQPLKKVKLYRQNSGTSNKLRRISTIVEEETVIGDDQEPPGEQLPADQEASDHDNSILEALRQVVRDCTVSDLTKRPSALEINETLQCYLCTEDT
ncbi:hypothetical protein HDE_09473 [Halotydeus destructor]|nr:hypothetical protein HDE_09473 [Halotydeus destructor]